MKKSKDVYVLPPSVTEQIDKIKKSDNDWTMFAVNESDFANGKGMWLVAKLWEDPSHFNIIAAIVKYESQEVFNS